MLTDVRGTILYVNDAWQRIYGFSKAEALGSTPRLLRSGHHDQDFYERMWKQILDPKQGFWKGEVINRAKDGREVAILLSISPFREGGETIQGYLSIASDISEKKQMEAQILRQDRLVSIGLLASGLAHEIGTPLGVIRGRAEYLTSDPAQTPQARRFLDVIVHQADRISKLVNSLLNVARLSSADAVAPVRVAAVLREVAGLVSQSLKEQGIELKLQVDERVRVLAEASRLEQVFLNVVMNAIHAIESAIAGGDEKAPYIRISAERRMNQWEIAVEDSGCGISPEAQQHLFKPFFTTKDVGKGTGLGLAITHQLIHAWGGTIWAESSEGRPTVFRIRLPVA
jgi:PAS domain S-box-containing protein